MISADLKLLTFYCLILKVVRAPLPNRPLASLLTHELPYSRFRPFFLAHEAPTSSLIIVHSFSFVSSLTLVRVATCPLSTLLNRAHEDRLRQGVQLGALASFPRLLNVRQVGSLTSYVHRDQPLLVAKVLVLDLAGEGAIDVGFGGLFDQVHGVGLIAQEATLIYLARLSSLTLFRRYEGAGVPERSCLARHGSLREFIRKLFWIKARVKLFLLLMTIVVLPEFLCLCLRE